MMKENDIDSAASSSNTVSSVEDACSQGIESLWADIDFAERCLVSAMNQEAADRATRVLRMLCRRGSGDGICEGDESVEFASMLEAAGMVLLQALNEMGRSREIFANLISILESVHRVPYSLILTGADYMRLAEIYVIEILAKVENNSAAALLWIKVAPISEEDKKAILEKLLVVSQSQQRSINHNSSKPSTEALTSGSVNKPFQEKCTQISNEASVDLVETLGIRDSEASRSQSAPSVSGGSEFSAVQRDSGTYSRLPLSFVRGISSLAELIMIPFGALATSNRTSPFHRFCQRRTLVTGAFASLFVYALLWKRQYLKRLLRSMLSAMRKYFGEIWQLAFSVHLSPLATVEPLPTGRVL